MRGAADGTRMPWSNRCFIVAEIGANHHQSLQKAIALVYAAQKVGADAVKVQMFEADGMAAKDGQKVLSGPWKGKTLYDLYTEAAMPLHWVPRLKGIAEGLGLGFFASVYYPEMVPIAEECRIPIYKIASYELVFDKLIEEVSKTGKPVIISTGSGELAEISRAAGLVRKHHNNLALLACTSSYPAPLRKMRLHTILDMRKRFKCAIGLSDHSVGLIAPVAAVALGARVIEKHLTLDGKGLDGGFSLMPDKFFAMTESVRATEKALGTTGYGGKKNFRRKLIDGRWLRSV